MKRFSRRHAIHILLALLLVALLVWAGHSQGELLHLAKGVWQGLARHYAAHPVGFPLLYMLGYTICMALYIPVTLILMILAGTVFGLPLGIAVILLAHTAGATIGFLIARHFLYGRIQLKYGYKLGPINEGFRRSGWFYLFALRVLPLMPAQLVNLLIALTPIRTATFAIVTLIGSITHVSIYVFIGTRLMKLDNLKDAFPPQIFAIIIPVLLVLYFVKKQIEKKVALPAETG